MCETTISVIPKKYEEDYLEDPRKVRDNQGQDMKGGKFLMKLFPDSSHAEIHEFLASLEGGTIDVVKGEDIRNWYHGVNYSRTESTDSLGASCMKHGKCQTYFDIYVNNPDVCQMAILKDEANLLKGRALLWNGFIDNNPDKPIKFMDRIYGTAQTVQLFKAWAKKHGYWYKERQCYDNYGLTDGRENEMNAGDITVRGNFVAKEYPYMDTMDGLNQDSDLLSRRDAYFSLKSTSGGGGRH